MRGRVLVVEDDEAIRRMVSMALFDQGYEVLSAGNGAVALEREREHPADVILLDMNMPIMDGWEFARRYKELGEAAEGGEKGARRGRRSKAALIVMTAAVSAQARAEQVGADDFVAKPFDLDDLLDVVERNLPNGPDRGRGHAGQDEDDGKSGRAA